MSHKLLTVTLNPAIDINYPIRDFQIDKVQRTKQSFKSAGGKGLNVARVAHLLDLNVCCTGIVGGHFGEWLKTDLDRSNMAHQFISSPVETRLCIAINSDHSQTEILESGATHPTEMPQQFLAHFAKLITDYDFITISGSLPKGFDTMYYVRLLEIAHEAQKKVCMDTSGDALKSAILHSQHCPPYLIKPNSEELAMLTNDSASRDVRAILTAPHLAHIPNIMLSQGAEGAVLRTKEACYQYTIPKIKVVNPVGSGDSSVAGFCYGLAQTQSPVEATKYAMAAGVCNAMEHRTGYIDLTNYQHVLSQIHCTKVAQQHD